MHVPFRTNRKVLRYIGPLFCSRFFACITALQRIKEPPVVQWGFLLWGYFFFHDFSQDLGKLVSNVQDGDYIYMGTCAHACPNAGGRTRGCVCKRTCAQVCAFVRTSVRRYKRVQVYERACVGVRTCERAPMRAPQPSVPLCVRKRGRTNHAHTHNQAQPNTPHPTNGGALRHLTARLRA